MRDGPGGAWQGEATRAPVSEVPRDPFKVFKGMAGYPRAATLDLELGRLVSLELDPSNRQVARLQSDLLATDEPLVTLTRPSNAELATAQLPHIRAAADLRGDHMAEIFAQMADPLSFFGAAAHMDGGGRKWTLEVMSAVMRFASAVAMPIKLHLDVPRPMEFSEWVQPPIQTPAHGSWPSAHATEVFAMATVLAALSRDKDSPNELSPDALIADRHLLMRLATRIADNRTMAGVHFPTDSFAGATLGIALGSLIVQTVDREGAKLPVTLRSFGAGEGDQVPDFSLSALGNLPTLGTADVDATGHAQILKLLWAEARAEWR